MRGCRRLGIRGLLIDSVEKGTGAAKAGLRGTVVDRRGYIRQLGDIIVKIDDKDVRTLNELRDVLEAYSVGDEVRVTFVRDDTTRTVTVKLKYIN